MGGKGVVPFQEGKFAWLSTSVLTYGLWAATSFRVTKKKASVSDGTVHGVESMRLKTFSLESLFFECKVLSHVLLVGGKFSCYVLGGYSYQWNCGDIVLKCLVRTCSES